MISLLDRRSFLQLTGGSLAAAFAARSFASLPQAESNRIDLPPLSASTEATEKLDDPGLPHEQRVGFAVVGLGHIALERVLPAFARSKYARLTALVSGSREKALKAARRFNVPENAVFDYAGFERLADHAPTQVVYIALPNGMHAEYTARSARGGKHVLCEKPMAVSVGECQQMIDACRQAKVKLMIAYRSQYEPLDRALVKSIRAKELGTLQEFVAVNSQNQGDPHQWRLNRKMAGGGPLPDVGIYCLNAARFLSGEEPSEVLGSIVQPKDDPRFREVESSAQFLLKFPSGFTATASCGYSSHKSQFFRVQGSTSWAELSPAFAYDNLKLRYGKVENGREIVTEPSFPPADQFAREIDHFAECVLLNRQPTTGGDEGLQDQRIVDAIYRSASIGAVVKLDQPPSPVRGPEPKES